MALEVEDGTGKANAESYASLDTASSYATSRGLTFPIAGDDAAPAERALRRATTWVDGTYRARFSGYRKNGRNQALEWPRSNATDAMPIVSALPDNEVPIEVVNATIEAAVRELASPASLSPDITPGKIMSEVSVEGAVAVKYALPGGVQDQRPVMTVVDNILGTLIGFPASSLAGSSSRG